MSIDFGEVFTYFFIIGCILLYIISIILLRPFRIHRKRKKTTVSLKVSYLIFLAVFLVFTCLLLFGKKNPDNSDNIAYDTLFNIHFLFYLTATIVPNIGIMIRKKVKKNRVEYNLMFTVVNLLYFSYLMYAIISEKWALL